VLHSTVLKQLMPLDLGDTADADLTVEGQNLDHVASRAVDLLREMFADGAFETLADWERVYGLTPGADDPAQLRQVKLINKMRETGDIHPPRLVEVAATMGYTVAIDQLAPFMAGCGHAGDAIYAETIRWQWKVAVSGVPAYYFRAGQSAVGERLSWFQPATALEALFNDLKPADVWLWFIYP